jgi:hypothetical protein
MCIGFFAIELTNNSCLYTRIEENCGTLSPRRLRGALVTMTYAVLALITQRRAFTPQPLRLEGASLAKTCVSNLLLHVGLWASEYSAYDHKYGKQ